MFKSLEMLKSTPLIRNAIFFFFISVMPLVNSACSNQEVTNPAEVKTAKVKKVKATPEVEATVTSEPELDSYEEAVDLATSATVLSKSAVIREDWSLVASRWQEAIQLLKAVPTSSPNYNSAQEKIPQYQNFFTQAQAKATPEAKLQQTIEGNTKPQFFLAPIKKRFAGIPVVEVKFNDQYSFDMAFDTGASNTLITGDMAYKMGVETTGSKRVGIADGSVVTLSTTVLSSINIDNRVQRNLPVSIAPNMPIGLLGQDFFAGYDVTIRQNVIEFSLR